MQSTIRANTHRITVEVLQATVEPGAVGEGERDDGIFMPGHTRCLVDPLTPGLSDQPSVASGGTSAPVPGGRTIDRVGSGPRNR